MSNRKKALIWLVIIIGILCLYFGTPGIKKTILIFGGSFFLLWIIHQEIRTLPIDEMNYNISRRFRQIEHRLGILDEPNEKDMIAKPVAYKIHLGLLPNWKTILDKLAEQNEQKPDDFIKEILNDKELKIEERKGLWGGSFWFDIYQDEFSGMRQVWSHHHKALVDSWVIEGRLFDPWPTISHNDKNMYKQETIFSHIEPKKYAANYLRQFLTLTPYGAWFDQLSCENDVFKDGKIAKIPYFDIIKLLLELGKILTPHTYAIQKFPNELQKKLEESNIRYDNEPYSFQDYGTESDFSKDENFDLNEIGWNDKQWFKDKGIKLYVKTVDSHVFHTPYYSVSISLEIFEPPRLPYRF